MICFEMITVSFDCDGYMMIDKERTIRKAKAKYKEIRPILGKKTLEECFFSLRGEVYFQFRTKDKKRHIVRALWTKTSLQVPAVHWGYIVEPVRRMVNEPMSNSPVLKLMTRPIRVRDLFRKKQLSR